MMRPRVVLTHALDPAAQERLAQHAEVRVLQDTRADALRTATAEADLLITRVPLPQDLFALSPHLIGAVRCGAGLDSIPLEAATAAGVPVANVPGVNAPSVAEYVLSQMLSVARRLHAVDHQLRTKDWFEARAFGEAGSDLHGKTLGIVGTGAVGSAIGRAAGLGLGMAVLGHRRSADPLPPPFQRATLDEVIERGDYLVLACPLTDQTRGLIDARRLARMKHGAWLINVARGAVVVESDLVDALARGQLGGAILDVFETQPLPADSPLRGFDNVLLSPHLAGTTQDSLRRIAEVAVAQALDLLAGRRLPHLVNPAVWPQRRTRRFALKDAP